MIILLQGIKMIYPICK